MTGATGFIGGHVVAALCEAGHAVRCLARPTSTRARLAAYPVEWVVGDLLDAGSLVRATEGVEWVFHLASLLKVPWKPAFQTVNVEGTRALVSACATQITPPVVVLVSSLAAAGPSRAGPRVEGELAAPVSIYGAVKRAAEQAAAGFAGRLPLTVVRPPMVFGEGDRGALPLFRTVARGYHLVPSLQPRRLSLVHAYDLARALVVAARRGERVGAGEAGVGIYHVCDSTPVGYEALGLRVAHAMGISPPRIVRLPLPVTRLVAGASEWTARLRDRPTVLNLDKVRELAAGDWTADPAKAIAHLDFAPAALDDRLRETAAWYRVEGWL